MLGKLNENQIEKLLEEQYIGRIGCHSDDKTYIVPINYVYKDGYVYAHSALGKKIKMLRKNPKLCFQVDDIKSILDWKSVIAWGVYEEINGREEMQHAMHLIIQHIMPMMKNTDGHPSHGITQNESDIGDTVDLILYKIRLKKKTGRFEEPEKNASSF